MHGDRVVAAVRRKRRGRFVRLDGAVTRVVERGTTRILGVVHRGRVATYLRPRDPRMPYTVELTGAADAPDGAVVVATIVRYPDEYTDVEARVETVLGAAGDPGIETEAVIAAHGLPRDFPPAVAREAARLPAEVTAASLPATLPPAVGRRRPWHESHAAAARVDLRDLPLVTIDGEQARDFDDAVALLDGPGATQRLLVAIADVGAYVAPGSAIDREARARGTSVYFPERVLPMLPEALSNGICSLSPGVDRLVQAVLLDIDRRGEVRGAAFFPGIIRSRARLTYTEVREIVVDGALATRRRHAELVDGLERLVALGELLARIRRRRGAIDLDLPEAEVHLDSAGRPETIVAAERNAAHRMIESCMLAANEAVAQYLTAVGVALPYRVHEPPDEDVLRDLARFLAGFGLAVPTHPDQVKPGIFQQILTKVAGRPEARLVNTIVLRSMKQARYTPTNLGHFGLASKRYTHFTSPIRRYPDLMVHRILAAHLAGDEQALGRATTDLGAVCEESSQRERVAMEAEREVVQLFKVQLMRDKTGETFDGFVSGVTSFGFFVELTTYFVEGLVHVATLTDDRYDLVEHEHALAGRRFGRRYRLGDPVRVRVASVSLERRQIDLVVDDG